MSRENYLNKIKELPEAFKQLSSLVLITIIIFLFIFALNMIKKSDFFLAIMCKILV